MYYEQFKQLNLLRPLIGYKNCQQLYFIYLNPENPVGQELLSRSEPLKFDDKMLIPGVLKIVFNGWCEAKWMKGQSMNHREYTKISALNKHNADMCLFLYSCLDYLDVIIEPKYGQRLNKQPYAALWSDVIEVCIRLL